MSEDTRASYLLGEGWFPWPVSLKAHGGAWFNLMFKDGKSHSVPRHLVHRVVDDMNERGCPLEWWKPSNLTGLDTGGMCRIGEPVHIVRLGPLQIKIRVTDVADFASEIQRLKLRRFSDGVPYYKLHSRFWCLVLRPGQKQELENTLLVLAIQVEPEAEAEIDMLRGACDKIAASSPYVKFAPRGEQ